MPNAAKTAQIAEDLEHGHALCAEVGTVSASRDSLSVRKQIEGQIAWGVGDARWRKSPSRNAWSEGNLDQFRIARMADYPPKVNIASLKANNKRIPAGEEVIPQIAPAIAQAVFKITGNRIRSLPSETTICVGVRRIRESLRSGLSCFRRL